MRRLLVPALALACGCSSPRLAANGTPDATTASSTDAPPTGGVARLIAPLSTSTVTQQRPTLHWTGAVDSPVVDLCLDRACTQPLAIGVDVAANGTSGTVAAPLPPGWIFWRVRAAAGTSATWQFFVGTLSASTAVDSSSGTTLDVNGDGYGDFLVGGGGIGAAYLYLGNAGGTNLMRIELTAPDGSSGFGGVVTNLGDINGDGYSDFWVAPSGHLYLGGPNVDASNWNGVTAPDRIDSEPSYSPVPIGDVNGDGYADLLIPEGYIAYIYFGEPTATLGNLLELESPDGTTSLDPRFGTTGAGAGDVNGDGYADFVVGTAPSESDVTRAFAHLYLGGPTPTAADWNVTPSPDRIDLATPNPTDPYAGYYGLAVSGAGDVDGDGYSDFVVGAMCTGTNTVGYTGTAYFYLGAPTPAAADWTSVAHTQRIDVKGVNQMDELGESMVPVGDVNGDGYADVLIGEAVNTSVSQYGGARLYLGAAMPSVAIWNGTAPSNRVDLATPGTSYGYFGYQLAAGGDVDGDGHADFLVSETGAPGGIAHYYRGEAMPTSSDYNGTTPPLRVDLSNPGTAGVFGNLR